MGVQGPRARSTGEPKSGSHTPHPSTAPQPAPRPLSLPGQGIKRVKPKRSTSFFSRQLSVGQGSYTVVQPADSGEQESG